MLQFIFDPSLQYHMWFAIGLTVATFYAFTREDWPLEITSVVLLAILLLFGQIFPILGDDGKNMLGANFLLMGFSNPSLIAVLALLVIGQAMVQTAALTPITSLFLRLKPNRAIIGLVIIFLLVMIVSAVLNNTPLVIIAIPVLQALASRGGIPDSKVMIPLSYVAILGGMMTLVGSSTNMLVSSALSDLGYEPFGFFSFTIPGAMLAFVGSIYVFFIMPFFLPTRGDMATDLKDKDRKFVAELDIKEGDSLIGEECCSDGTFEKMPDVSVRMIQRSGSLILPPFENYAIEAEDVLIVAATQATILDLLGAHPGVMLSENGDGSEDVPVIQALDINDDSDDEGKQEGVIRHILVEVMIPPTSNMIDMSVNEIEFKRNFGCMVLGVQRRAHVVRRRIHQIRLEAGDVLLMAGEQEAIWALRDNKDLMPLAGSKRDVPVTKKAPMAAVVFFGVVATASSGVLPIPVAAVIGAVLMVLTGCLNVKQVMRAFDRKIFFLVGAALALGTTLQVTEGATFIADLLLELPFAQDPFHAACVLFILVAICTNLLTNNACAILFTPIAVNLATQLGADPIVFAMTVVFAANCSFASPIGYQTNLLVMGPGHYQFKDFMKAGIPLVLIIWIAYGFIAKYYFGL